MIRLRHHQGGKFKIWEFATSNRAIFGHNKPLSQDMAPMAGVETVQLIIFQTLEK